MYYTHSISYYYKPNLILEIRMSVIHLCPMAEKKFKILLCALHTIVVTNRGSSFSQSVFTRFLLHQYSSREVGNQHFPCNKRPCYYGLAIIG